MAALDNTVRWTSAGLEAVHVAYRNASGWIAGFSNLTVTNTNTGSGMRRLEGAELFPGVVSEPDTKPIPGDDAVYDSFEFASPNPQSGILEAGGKDFTLENAFEGMTAYSEGIYNILGRGDTLANPGTFIFLLTRQAHGKDSTSLDQPGFETEIVLSTRVRALSDEVRRHQEVGKMRYNVTMNNSRLLPWGESTTTAMGVASRRSIVIVSLYRLMLHVWVADGTATTTSAFDYTPAISTAAYTKAWNGLTGADLTVTSVSTANKTVTLSGAPTSGVPVVILYPVLSF